LADADRGGQQAVAVLIDALGDEDEEVAWRAARALSAFGPEAAAAVPALTEALSSPSSKVQAYAAYALGQIGEAAEPATEALLDCVFREDLMVRRAALKAIRAIDPPKEKTRPVLLKLLKEGEATLVASVLRSLAEEGEAVVPRLCGALDDDELCYWACIVLGEIGPAASEALPQLTELLDHEDPDVRMQALVTLGEIGEASAPAVPAILERVNTDEFESVKLAAVYALGNIGVDNDETVEAIIEVAKSKDPFLHLVGVWALARLRPEKAEGVQYAASEIAKALKSQNPRLRMLAAQALVELKAPRELVAPAMVRALEDADPRVVDRAIDALAALGPQVIIPRIDRPLSNPKLREVAVRLLIRFGPDAAGAVPALIDALESLPEDGEEARQFRRGAHFALAAIGPAAADAVPLLIEALSSEDPQVRGSAAYALGKIGPAAEAAVPHLRERLPDLDTKDKIAFVWALLQIVPDDESLAETAVPYLIEGLEFEEDLAREEAARSLGRLGPSARAAVTKLQELAENDPSPAVRAAASQALEQIQP
jgi:HEAT repeat protein